MTVFGLLYFKICVYLNRLLCISNSMLIRSSMDRTNPMTSKVFVNWSRNVGLPNMSTMVSTSSMALSAVAMLLAPSWLST